MRQRESGLYYRGKGDWVSNAYDALTFANILEAEAFCRLRQLGDLQVIQQSGYFFRAPRYRPLPAAIDASTPQPCRVAPPGPR